jgi:ribosome-binding factor A
MQRLTLRTVPALRFVYDESVEQGDRIERLLRRALGNDGKPS